MLADLQAGQGTAGKLLKDPALFDEAQKTIAEISHAGGAAQLRARARPASCMKDDAALPDSSTNWWSSFNTTMDKINAGQGTLGQFMVNPQLYDSLNGATHEFQSLAKDMRANPKKFLTIRLTLF